MFKIFIAGKTIKELRDNLQEFLDALDHGELGEEIEVAQPSLVSQPVKPPIVAPPPKVPTYVPPVTQAAAPSGPVELDSRGIPWDERVHSASRATKGDGSWRIRRGVEDSLVKAVENDLKARAGGPSNVAVSYPSATPINQPVPPYIAPVTLPPSQPPQQPAAPVAPQPTQVHIAPFATQMAVQPQHDPSPLHGVPTTPVAPPPMPPPQVATSAHTIETFKANLIGTLAKLVGEGKLNQEYINSLKAYFQVEQIWQVNDAQLVEMFESFVNHGILTKVG